MGFSECLQTEKFDSYKEGRLLLRLQKFQLNQTEEHSKEIDKIKQEKSESKSCLIFHLSILYPLLLHIIIIFYEPINIYIQKKLLCLQLNQWVNTQLYYYQLKK